MTRVIGGTAWTLTIATLMNRLSPELVPAEAIAGEYSDEQRQCRHPERHDVAVQEEPQLGRIGQDLPVGVERKVLRDEPRRNLEDLAIRLQRCRQHPNDREPSEDRTEAQTRDHTDLHADASPRLTHGHDNALSLSCRT